MGSSLAAESSFSSSGFASLGKSGASGGTGVAGEAETLESGDKTLAGVSSVSQCSGIEANVRTFLSPSLVYRREHVLPHPRLGPIGPVQ